MDKLDREYGTEGLVLGDSLYEDVVNSIKEEKSGSSPWAVEVFGHRLIEGRFKSADFRFFYGQVFENLRAKGIDGNIYEFNVTNSKIDTSRFESLIDSLRSKYGSVSSKKDTSYEKSVSDSVYSRKEEVYKWSADSVEIEGYIWDKEGVIGSKGYGFTVRDKELKGNSVDVKEKVISLTDKEEGEISELKSIGNLPTDITVESRMVKTREMEFGGRNTGSYYTDYRNLKPFFEIDEPDYPSFYVSLEFSSDTDSLTSVEIDFPTEGSYRSITSYSELLTKVGEKFGKYDLSMKKYSEEGVFRERWWFGGGKSLVLKEESDDEINVEFILGRKPILELGYIFY